MGEALAIRSIQSALAGVVLGAIATSSYGMLGLASALMLTESWLCLSLLRAFGSDGYRVRYSRIAASCFAWLGAPFATACVTVALGASEWTSANAVILAAAITFLARRRSPAERTGRTGGSTPTDIRRAA